MDVLQPGTLIDGRYRIEAKLGAGGMGSLYLAEQLAFGRTVAVKIMSRGEAASASMRARFEREAKAVCSVQHPHIVTYYDFGTDPGTGLMFLVMELLRGSSLFDVHKREKPLEAARVVRILAQLAEALSEAHDRGVIHRDLKPANVMLVKRGTDPDFVKLIDFGIVRLRDADDELTNAGQIVGTTSYLAPEYIKHQIVDRRLDIYALGVIAYELIAGRKPFMDKDPVKVLRMHVSTEPPPMHAFMAGRHWPDLADLEALIRRTLAKDPLERPQSARAFRTHLLAVTGALRTPEASAPTRGHDSKPETEASIRTTERDAPAVREQAEAHLAEARKKHPTGRDRTREMTGPAPAETSPAPAVEATPTPRTTPPTPRTATSPGPTPPPAEAPRRSPMWIVAAAVVVALVVGAGITRLLESDPPATPTPAESEKIDIDVSVNSTAAPKAGASVAAAPPDLRRVRVSEVTRRASGIELYAEPPAIAPTPTVAPTEPKPVKPKTYTVRINPYPHGTVKLRGRVIGTGFTKVKVPAGRHCFSSSNGQRKCVNVRSNTLVKLGVRPK